MSLWFWLTAFSHSLPLYPLQVTMSVLLVSPCFFQNFSAIDSRAAVFATRKTHFPTTSPWSLLYYSSSLIWMLPERRQHILTWVGSMPESMDGMAMVQPKPPGWLQHPWETAGLSCLFLHPLMGSLPSVWVVHFITIWGTWLSLRLFLPVRFDWSRSMTKGWWQRYSQTGEQTVAVTSLSTAINIIFHRNHSNSHSIYSSTIMATPYP